MTAFNPSSTMMQFRRYSIELYERLGVFEASAACAWRRRREQLRELERTASRARGIGLDADVIGPTRPADSCRRSRRSRCSGRSISPATATSTRTARPMRVADAARALGVRIRQGVRVTGFELSPRREVIAC